MYEEVLFMKRFFILAVALLAMFSVVLMVGAQEDSVTISGTLKGEAEFLPSFANWYGLDLTLTFSGLKVISQTYFTVAPGVTGTQVFKVEYASFANWYGLDLTLTFSGLKVISQTYFTIAPGVTGTQVFKLEYAWDFLTLGSELDLGLVPPAFQSLSLYAEAR
jgi:hypothetical protein